MKVSSKGLISLLCGGVAILLLVLAAVETTYPPIFSRKQFTELISIYGTDCGVIDREASVTDNALRCDIYLKSHEDPGSPKFEGQRLRHKYDQLRNGYSVEGEGRILWNKNEIEVEGRTVRVNGHTIRAGVSCGTIEPDGAFTEGRRARAY